MSDPSWAYVRDPACRPPMWLPRTWPKPRSLGEPSGKKRRQRVRMSPRSSNPGARRQPLGRALRAGESGVCGGGCRGSPGESHGPPSDRSMTLSKRGSSSARPTHRPSSERSETRRFPPPASSTRTRSSSAQSGTRRRPPYAGVFRAHPAESRGLRRTQCHARFTAVSTLQSQFMPPKTPAPRHEVRPEPRRRPRSRHGLRPEARPHPRPAPPSRRPTSPARFRGRRRYGMVGLPAMSPRHRHPPPVARRGRRRSPDSSAPQPSASLPALPSRSCGRC